MRTTSRSSITLLFKVLRHCLHCGDWGIAVGSLLTMVPVFHPMTDGAIVSTNLFEPSAQRIIVSFLLSLLAFGFEPSYTCHRA